MSFHSPYQWALEAHDRIAGVERSSPSSKIDIVFASDRAFLPYTAVAVSTVLGRYKDRRKPRIILLLDEPLAPDARKKFEELNRLTAFDLVEVPVDGAHYAGLRTTPGISVATYFRLKMHELLPRDCTKVVYLDADIVVRHCISELADFDLGESVMAGIEDTVSKHYLEKLSQHPSTRHVNAGVLILDIDLLRKIDFTDLANRFIAAKRYTLQLGDQEILTGVLGLDTRLAPVRWNVHGSMFERDWVAQSVGKKNAMDAVECSAAIRDPALIHYTYKRKPWVAPDHPCAKEWFAAAAQTAYRFELGV